MALRNHHSQTPSLSKKTAQWITPNSGLSHKFLLCTGFLGFLVRLASCVAGRPLWDVGQYAVGTPLPPSPPLPPLPGAADGHSGLQRPTTLPRPRMGWVGWSRKQEDGLGKDTGLAGVMDG